MLPKDLTTVRLKRDCWIDDGHSKNFYKKGTEFYLTDSQVIDFKRKLYI